MEWTPTFIKFSIDDIETGKIPAADGFWQRGNFNAKVFNVENPWKYGTLMAPFDKEFYILINLAVGGAGYFPDAASNPNNKPWVNKSPTSARDFWNGRSQWEPTWKFNSSTNSALKIDYVKVWAI